MVAVRGHYDGGVVLFDQTPPACSCDVIVTFLDDDADEIDEVAAQRVAMAPKARFTDEQVRGKKAITPPVIDEDDGWE
jgi:hypothetical protein